MYILVPNPWDIHICIGSSESYWLATSKGEKLRKEKMGRIFVVELEGRCYKCKFCKTHLALFSDCVSRVTFSLSSSQFLLKDCIFHSQQQLPIINHCKSFSLCSSVTVVCHTNLSYWSFFFFVSAFLILLFVLICSSALVYLIWALCKCIESEVESSNFSFRVLFGKFFSKCLLVSFLMLMLWIYRLWFTNMGKVRKN